MDWKRAMREERVALNRIAALLYALACLAELAAGRSPIVRALVLLLLRQAEAIAREFVAGDPASMPVLPPGAAPADALRLAASLRALAGQIDRQARLIVGSRRKDRAGSPHPGPMPAVADLADRLSAIVASGTGGLRRVLAPDTS